MNEQLVALSAIVQAHQSSQPIPLDLVEEWMKSDDLEVLGAVCALVTDESSRYRISPSLATERLTDFLLCYYSLCFEEDPKGVWAMSRFEAARHIVGWFRGHPQGSAATNLFPMKLKNWLATSYRNGDESIRSAIVDGALEHILEEARWREFFIDWCTNPELKTAYDSAVSWAIDHNRD